ncbi:hypothetical protein, partial [Actinophytocola sp.]|uniref:hypothetical protein n=1 Tax=Actinophytocola sp. TaxID=1872138 RepID=UPI002D49694A
MTTTTVDPAPAPTGRCIVCQRDDLPILVSRHEDSANVIAGHSAADMPDVECTGSRLPVLPANAGD